MTRAAPIGKLLWAVVAILLFVFALLAVNQGQVALQFLSWQTPALSVFWWLLAAFLFGLVIATLVSSVTTMRLRLRLRSVAKQLDDSHRELQKLRGLPP